MANRRSFRRNTKAVSPVIATIIIVSVAIVMSIAVAYWMLGLGSSFTRFEKLEFSSAYVEDVSGNYFVHIKIKNTGSAALTIDSILLNGKPVDAYAVNGSDTVVVSWVSQTLEPGQQTDGTIQLTKGIKWTSGMSVEVTIHTTSGRDYPKVVVLP